MNTKKTKTTLLFLSRLLIFNKQSCLAVGTMNILIFLCFFLLGAPVLVAQQNPNFYGCYWNSNGLANLEIGKDSGRVVGYRFRAEYSGTITAVRIFLIFRALGYYAGDGGQVLMRIQSDDNSDSHIPSGTTLASSLITDPMAQGSFRTFTLDKSVTLKQGQLYHLIFTNPGPDPLHNYVSIDDIHLYGRPDMQPGIDDVSLAVLFKRSGSLSWEINYRHSPIFSLYYTDGRYAGVGYTDAASQSGLKSISGNAKVRENIHITGTNRIINAVYVRVKKLSGSTGLTIELKNASGQVLQSQVIPASSVPSSEYGWVGYSFSKPITLSVNKNYYLTLSAPAGDSYQDYPIRNGSDQGFYGGAIFTDGYMEYTTDDTTWLQHRSSPVWGMMFYFTITRPSTQKQKN